MTGICWISLNCYSNPIQIFNKHSVQIPNHELKCSQLVNSEFCFNHQLFWNLIHIFIVHQSCLDKTMFMFRFLWNKERHVFYSNIYRLLSNYQRRAISPRYHQSEESLWVRDSHWCLKILEPQSCSIIHLKGIYTPKKMCHHLLTLTSFQTKTFVHLWNTVYATTTLLLDNWWQFFHFWEN